MNYKDVRNPGVTIRPHSGPYPHGPVCAGCRVRALCNVCGRALGDHAAACLRKDLTPPRGGISVCAE